MKVIVANQKEKKALERIMKRYGSFIGGMPFCVSDCVQPNGALENYMLDNIFDFDIDVDESISRISKEDLLDYDEDYDEEEVE